MLLPRQSSLHCGLRCASETPLHPPRPSHQHAHSTCSCYSIVPPLRNFPTDAIETLNVTLNEDSMLPVIAELEMVTQCFWHCQRLSVASTTSSQQPTIVQWATDHIILDVDQIGTARDLLFRFSQSTAGIFAKRLETVWKRGSFSRLACRPMTRFYLPLIQWSLQEFCS
ncbi:hypothetical protein EDB83DRAFT_1773786 [Lactarius deliciosus]|nr:hypothetical protein EDB83DRAFT_1773786 [Lactarius deliciosus]